MYFCILCVCEFGSLQISHLFFDGFLMDFLGCQKVPLFLEAQLESNPGQRSYGIVCHLFCVLFFNWPGCDPTQDVTWKLFCTFSESQTVLDVALSPKLSLKSVTEKASDAVPQEVASNQVSGLHRIQLLSDSHVHEWQLPSELSQRLWMVHLRVILAKLGSPDCKENELQCLASSSVIYFTTRFVFRRC